MYGFFVLSGFSLVVAFLGILFSPVFLLQVSLSLCDSLGRIGNERSRRGEFRNILIAFLLASFV